MRVLTLKRVVDVLGALAGIVVLSPLMGVIAVLVRIRMGTPVLFRQVRPGLHGRPFTIHKFRTMRDLSDEDGRAFPDETRLTRLGRFLRATSLDELPELFNVLTGEMSLVGPRPLLMEYLDRYSPDQARRHEVKPGITGWAQVKGRNALSWEERFALDVWYVDHWSVWVDVKILVMTVVRVFTRAGVAQPGRATVDYFTGSPATEDRANAPAN